MEFLDKLLDYYNISLDEYHRLARDVSVADVPSFNVFKDISKAKELILNAVKSKEKILVYGDYDADGILATSIIVMMFKKLNYEVSYYIPSRYLDGYGITKEKVIKAKEAGYNLIITVDNGAVAYEAINTAKELKINMLITDHHEYVDEIKDFIFIHPARSSLKSTTSGAMVAFYLSYAVLYEVDPYLLTLGATSILSDIMPLRNENRDIVKLAIKYLNKYKFDKFNLLSGDSRYDESTLQLKVIPKINAVGRIEQNKEVNQLVKYFTTDSYNDLVMLREYLNNINEKRKAITVDIVNKLDVKDDVAVVLNLDILSGLSGLIANRILYDKNVPVCVFASSETNGCIRGSIRSKHGFNAMEFIKENENLFTEKGGHECAAGVVIKSGDFDTFKNKFLEYAKIHKFIPSSDNILINKDEINFKNYDLIQSFSPFGAEWREPTFLLKDIDASLIHKIGKNLEHLSINLSKDAKVIGFNYPFDSITSNTIDLVGKIKLNQYKNKTSLNFMIDN